MNKDSWESSYSHSEVRSAPGSMKLFYLFTIWLVVPDNECDLQLRMAWERLLTKQGHGGDEGEVERGRAERRKATWNSLQRRETQKGRGQDHIHANSDKFDNKVSIMKNRSFQRHSEIHLQNAVLVFKCEWNRKVSVSIDNGCIVLSVITKQKDAIMWKIGSKRAKEAFSLLKLGLSLFFFSFYSNPFLY